MNIFGWFGKAKLDQVSTSLVERLATFDPETMSEAGMLQMEEQLNDFLKRTEVARQEFNKEQSEYEQIQTLYNQRLSAAESLQAQLTQAQGAGGDTATLEKSLATLLTVIENSQSDVLREKTEAEEAKGVLTELELLTKEMSEGMKTARTQFQQAIRDLKSAEVSKTRAEMSAERAAEVAGLRKNGNKMSAALTAMQSNAANMRADADAAKRKAELLQPSNPEALDPLIVAEMQKAAGKPVAESVTDRLARLKSNS